MSNNPSFSSGKSIASRGLSVVPTSVRRPDLASLTDVRREMGKVYREMRVRRIETQDGTRMVYVLSQIGKLIQQDEIVARISALEFAIKARSAV